MSKKRIIEHDTDLTLRSDDYILKDSATNDTKKITPEAFVEGALDNYLAGYVSGLDSASASSDSDIFYTVVDGVQKKVSKSTILSADRTARTTAEGTIVANFAAPYDSTASYAVGDYCIKDLVLYKCISPTSGTWDSSKWTQVTALDLTSGVASDLADEIEARQSADETLQGEIDELPVDVKVDGVSVVDTNNVAQINNKANTTGTYDDLVVGTAQNLLSESFTEDKVPYNFRQSFNGARLEDEIVGGTVAWNQQLSLSNLPSDSALYSNTTYTVNGVTFTKNNDGSITIQTESGGATSEASVKIGNDARLEFIKNHIHYIPRCKGGSASTYYFNYAGSRYVYDNDKIFAKQPSGFNMWLIVKQGTVITTPVKVYPQVVDLEQMFGSTIANYIYSLEEATAGSGVAYFRNLFPKSYYAYNSGTLMSVNASSHDTVGKNLFDNVWSDYTQPSDYRICPIRLEQGKTYTISATKLDTVTGCTVAFVKRGNQYSEFGSFDTIVNSSGVVSSYIPKTFTVDASYESPKLAIYCPNEDVFNSIFDNYEIQLEEGSTATTYEPYTKHTYPLDSDLTLRGIPKLDSNNNLYYDGDTYESDGSVTRRYGVVDLGSLSWETRGTGVTGKARFVATLTGAIQSDLTNGAKSICDKYGLLINGGTYNATDNGYTLSTNAINMYVEQYSTSTAETFKSAMNGVYLVYKLATPTSETADAFINPQIVDARGTEEYVDYAESQGTRDVAIPVGHNSKYYADLKSKIENIPDVPSTNGTYTLKATRSASGVTYAWVSG